MPFNAARTAMTLLSLASVAFVAMATQQHLGAAPAPLVISVVDHGADPTGKEDATTSFRAALAEISTNCCVWIWGGYTG